MGLSLYKTVVPSYLQILGAVAGLLDKAEEHCAAKGVPPENLIQARLAEDMLPFSFQITSVCHHSIGAIDGVRKGVFSPATSALPEDFATLATLVADARSALEALTEDEVNDCQGKPMRFEYGEYKIDFVAEGFLLSFSQPNFYFHATTAYDILRWQGLPIGKADFMGQLTTV